MKHYLKENMNWTKKKVGVFLGCMLLLAGFVVPVAAEEYTGGSDWAVTFDANGRKLESNFTTAQFQEIFRQMQPGDSARVTLALKNGYASAVNWYMDNDIISSLEQSSGDAETSGGVYTYQLIYKSPNENTERILFQSGSIGGEYQNRSKDEQGLNEINDSYMMNYDENNVNSSGEAYFYLDNLSSGQSGTITLYLKLDGETQGNYYQDTLAALEMKFAVDLTQRSSNTGNRNTNTTSGRVGTIVKTGDNSHNLLYIILAAVAGVILLVLAIFGVKMRKQESKEEETAEDISEQDRKEGM